jgi:MFS-type transporter involved in bile tolerance (Atg22 family)
MAIIGGLSTSIFMPYAGAVVDYSDHRLEFGRVCAALLTIVNFIQIFIFENTWFAMVILQSVVASATFMANSMVMWSYVNAPTDHDLHGVTASGRVWETFGMLSFFIVVGGTQLGSGWGSISIARFSQALATGVGGISLFLAYKRYSPVKAVKFLPEGSNLYIAGISELKSTMTSLSKHEPRAARFLLASVFNEAAISAFTNLAIVYLSGQVCADSFQY